MHKVYIDVLYMINFLIDFLLLSLTAKIRGRSVKILRISLGAFIGAFCSLSIFLPPVRREVLWFIQMLSALIMTMAAFKFKGIVCLLKDWFTLFCISFFTAGILYFLFTAFDPDVMTMYNGVVYFDISAALLIFNIAVAYFILTLFEYMVHSSRVAADFYDVTIHMFGKTADVKGMVDTGNGLHDVFSNAPVAVCGIKAVSCLLTENITTAVSQGDMAELAAVIDGETARNFRMIPYCGVHSGGLLPAFKADRIILKRNGLMYNVENAYIALCTSPLNSSYDILLSPNMVSTNSIRQVEML